MPSKLSATKSQYIFLILLILIDCNIYPLLFYLCRFAWLLNICNTTKCQKLQITHILIYLCGAAVCGPLWSLVAGGNQINCRQVWQQCHWVAATRRQLSSHLPFATILPTSPRGGFTKHRTRYFNLVRWVDTTYRVFSKGRNAVGPSKSLIFWTFPGVLGFFRPFNMGDFSFWYFWDIWLKKKFKNLIL